MHLEEGEKICEMCEHTAIREGYGARKMVEFDPYKKQAMVYH